MAKRRYTYEDNDASITERHAEGGGDFDRPLVDTFPLFTPKEGRHRIRILHRTWPESEGPRHWAFPLYLHYDVGADNGRYPCREKMGHGPCPICEERSRLAAEGDDEGAKALRPSMSQLTWVIDRSDEDAGPKLYMMPPSSMESEICDLSRDEDGGLIRIDHPEDGYDVIFSRKGSGRNNTEYRGVKLANKPEPITDDDDEFEEWIKVITDNPLPSMVKEYDYDYIARVFGAGVTTSSSGGDQGGDDDEGFDQVPLGRRRRGRSSMDELDEPEGDEEYDEGEDDEGEDEAPRRRSRTRSGGALDDAATSGRRRTRRGSKGRR